MWKLWFVISFLPSVNTAVLAVTLDQRFSNQMKVIDRGENPAASDALFAVKKIAEGDSDDSLYALIRFSPIASVSEIAISKVAVKLIIGRLADASHSDIFFRSLDIEARRTLVSQILRSIEYEFELLTASRAVLRLGSSDELLEMLPQLELRYNLWLKARAIVYVRLRELDGGPEALEKILVDSEADLYNREAALNRFVRMLGSLNKHSLAFIGALGKERKTQLIYSVLDLARLIEDPGDKTSLRILSILLFKLGEPSRVVGILNQYRAGSGSPGKRVVEMALEFLPGGPITCQLAATDWMKFFPSIE